MWFMNDIRVRSLFPARPLRSAVLSLCGLIACAPDEPALRSSPAAQTEPSTALWHAADAMPVDDPGARPVLCARPGDDEVRDIFCADGLGAITSLLSLQTRLRVNSFPPTTEEQLEGEFTTPPTDLVVFLSHSTALSGHLVSPINPRVILLGRGKQLAFQRGTQKVEVVVRDRRTNLLNFYLVSFSQACNRAPSGCGPGDLFTPRIESDWEHVRLDDAEDLKNTPLDCRQCHQRGRAQPMLLMRELRAPWTHFFGIENFVGALDAPGPSGTDLMRDFLRAKGDEPYANVPSAYARNSAGFFLEGTVERAQPLIFDSVIIERELSAQEAGGTAPAVRRSASWDRAYAAFKRGEQLPLPHFETRPTDPDKLARLTDAYSRYRSGQLAAEALPDLADVFPDDPRVRAEIGLQTEPDATPAEALIQACAPCHSDVLDPSISRARFTVALERLDARERALAIARLELPPSAQGAMPPQVARALPPDVRARLIAYLRANVRPAEDDALLRHAAEQGMMGNAMAEPPP